MSPRLEIDLSALAHNASQLCHQLAGRGIEITAVTKVTLGDPEIAAVLLKAGASRLADARLKNIQRLRNAGIQAPCMLLRAPALNEAEETVRLCDLSLNTEPQTLAALSAAATAQNRHHGVILMAELGDLREGLLAPDLIDVARYCHTLPGIELAGVGTNLACFGGVRPDLNNMDELSWLARELEARLHCKLAIISGGNSANFDWLGQTPAAGRINDLRLGEAIYLGCETLQRTVIPGLRTDVFTLVADVIESRVKPSVPRGEIGLNAFGKVPSFEPRGEILRSILNIGRQDASPEGLQPLDQRLVTLGASSDHLILDSQQAPLAVGDEVRFRLDYGALLTAMTSPFVEKIYC